MKIKFSRGNVREKLRIFRTNDSSGIPLKTAPPVLPALLCNCLIGLVLLVGVHQVTAQPLTVQFTIAGNVGPAPLFVQFNCPNVDSGGNQITNWSWNFGDSSTSTFQNPSHTYFGSGSFFPSLTAINRNGAAVVGSGPSILVLSPPPPVQFTANPTNGLVPLTVQFSGPSVDGNGSPIGLWNWSFGDGSSSSLQNPTHTYTNAGTFSPTLSLYSGPDGQSSGFGPSITVLPPPPPVQFTANPTNGLVPLIVQFNSPVVDGYGDTIQQWSWSFGDGSTSTLPNPSHAYATTGTFSPSLVVFAGADGSSQGLGPTITVTNLTYSVDWFKVAGGGGTSTNGVYTVTGTFGQQDAGGPMQGGGYSVEGGFWSPLDAQSSSVTGAAPTIRTQPQSLIIPLSAPAAFTVSASGAAPLYYQWQKNGINLNDGGTISGSTTSNLSFSATSTGDGGGYSVVIENAYGSVTSSVAKLTLIVPDIGAWGPSYGYAQGINNSGRVVGYSYPAGFGAYHAFLYSGGTMNDLGTLGGSSSSAYGINNSGQVVGYSYPAGIGAYHAFLYSGGMMNDLSTLGGSYSVAFAINAGGQVVGDSSVGNGDNHAFLYSGGVMNDLTTLGGDYSSAFGINASGQVVGDSYTAANAADHAFLYSGGTMKDLGTLGGTDSYALGINANGQVVGDSYTAGNAEDHVFLYSGGTMNDLGTLGGGQSKAYGINSSGQVVGYSYPAGNAAQHAFLYSGGTMIDLNNLINTNALGTYLADARGINDLGQIVANGNNGRVYVLGLTQSNNDAESAFSIANGNPNGVWSYTWSSSLDSPQTLYTINQTQATNQLSYTEGWVYSQSGFGIPLVAENATANQLGIWPPHTLGFHPGFSGEFSHVVWTAPTAGAYSVNVPFTMLDTGDTEVDVVLRRANGDLSHLASGNVAAPNTNYSYSGTLLLNAGDRVDFAVGWGNGVLASDTTALAPVVALLSLTNAAVINLPPKFQSAVANAGNCVFGWNTIDAIPPVSYQVQYTTNLSVPSWINLGAAQTGFGGPLSFTNAIGPDAQRFYRVLLVQ